MIIIINNNNNNNNNTDNNNNNNNNDNNNNKNKNIIYTLLTSEGLILFRAELRLSGFRANSLKAVNETSCGICKQKI